MNVLFVLTSHNTLGNTEELTGFWMEEFATPYYLLKDAGVSITIASPNGGEAPVDPKSLSNDFQTESTRRLEADNDTLSVLKNTLKLSEVDSKSFDAVFYPGGHGPLWDLTNDTSSIQLIEDFYKENKPIAAVCHAPAVLLNAKAPDGASLLNNREVTGYSNTEEIATGLEDIVPFLLEDALQSKGGKYRKVDDWTSFALQDGLIITGQNPASSEAVSQMLLEALKQSS